MVLVNVLLQIRIQHVLIIVLMVLLHGMTWTKLVLTQCSLKHKVFYESRFCALLHRDLFVLHGTSNLDDSVITLILTCCWWANVEKWDCWHCQRLLCWYSHLLFSSCCDTDDAIQFQSFPQQSTNIESSLRHVATVDTFDGIGVDWVGRVFVLSCRYFFQRWTAENVHQYGRVARV